MSEKDTSKTLHTPKDLFELVLSYFSIFKSVLFYNDFEWNRSSENNTPLAFLNNPTSSSSDIGAKWLEAIRLKSDGNQQTVIEYE